MRPPSVAAMAATMTTSTRPVAFLDEVALLIHHVVFFYDATPHFVVANTRRRPCQARRGNLTPARVMSTIVARVELLPRLPPRVGAGDDRAIVHALDAGAEAKRVGSTCS